MRHMKRTDHKQTPRRRQRTRQRTRFSPRTFVPYVAALLLLMTFIAVYASRNPGSASASGTTMTLGAAGKPLSWCGQDGRGSCPAVNLGWLPVTSDLPSDIARVIAASPDFARMRPRYGGVALDLPVLVHPYHPANPTAGSDYFVDDHWVVTARNSAGQEMGIFDYVYDRAQQRIRCSSYGVLTPRDARYGHVFPLVSSAEAVARVESQRRVSLLAGAAPHLVFFPLASDRQGPEAPRPWTGGGISPMDPLWLIVGNDGHNYFVASSLQTYTQGDLPIAST